MFEISFLIIGNVIFVFKFGNKSNVPTQPPNSATITYQDDYESYTVNTLPTGYYIRYSGSGSSWQVVTNSYAHSGSKSFRTRGTSSWSATIEYQATISGQTVAITASMMSETPSNIMDGDTGNVRIGFINPNQGEWGTGYGEIDFRNDGKIVLRGGSSEVVLASYTAFVWYDIKLIVTKADNKASGYVNGVLLGTTILANDADLMDRIFFGNGWHDITGYIDDVKVWDTIPSNDTSSQIFNFGTVFFDPFSSSTLNSNWTWSPHNSLYNLTTKSDWFQMQVASGEDTWGGSFISPRLYQGAPNATWSMETLISTTPGNHAQTGLIFFQDTTRWLVWGYVYDSGLMGVCLEGIENGVAREEINMTAINATQWQNGVHLNVKFFSSNSTFQFFYHLSNENMYHYVGNRILNWSNLQIGLWGKSWGGNIGYNSSFDFFNLSIGVYTSSNTTKPGNTTLDDDFNTADNEQNWNELFALMIPGFDPFLILGISVLSVLVCVRSYNRKRYKT